MNEIRYFFEDHWKKVLVGVLAVGIVVSIVLMITGTGGNKEEDTETGEDTGLVTEDNYDESTGDSETSEGGEDSEVDESEDSDEGETTDETEGSEEVVEEEQPQVEEEEVSVISYEDEKVNYGEDMEFELTEDLMVVDSGVTRDNLDKVLGEYSKYDDVKSEEDFKIEYGRFRYFSENVNNCVNENTEYGNCISELVSQLKWLEGSVGEDVDKSFKNLGELIANQSFLLEGMRAEAEKEDENLVKTVDALELELMLRADILVSLQSFEGESEEYRMATSDEVIAKLSQLTELESFVDNYLDQRMGLSGDE